MRILFRELNRSLQSHTAYWIVMILLLALSLSGMYMIWSDLNSVRLQYRRFSRHLADQTIYRLVYDDGSQTTQPGRTTADPEDMLRFAGALAEEPGIITYVTSQTTVELRSENRFLPASFNTFSRSSNLPETLPDPFTLSTVMVSPNVPEVLGLELSKGRWPSEDSYHYNTGTPVEVVLGSEYQDYILLGDRFDVTFMDDMTFEAVGFLREGALCPVDSGGVQVLDRSILCPAFTSAGAIGNTLYSAEKFMYSILINTSTPNIIPTDPSLNVKMLTSALSAQYQVPPVNLLMLRYENLSMIKSMSGQEVSITTTMSMLILGVFFVTLSILIAEKIRMNLKAYALYLLTGGTPFQIFTMMMAELVVILSCAFLMGFAALRAVPMIVSDVWFALNGLLVISLILLIVAALITLVHVWRLNILKLIRRDQT